MNKFTVRELHAAPNAEPTVVEADYAEVSEQTGKVTFYDDDGKPVAQFANVNFFKQPSA